MSNPALALLVPFRKVLELWRRSIQARVVIGTLTLSAVLALLAGWVMLRQVTSGVLDSKREAALSQAAAGFSAAQSRLDSAPDIDLLDVGSVLNPLLDLLAPEQTRSTTTASLLSVPRR